MRSALPCILLLACALASAGCGDDEPVAAPTPRDAGPEPVATLESPPKAKAVPMTDETAKADAAKAVPEAGTLEGFQARMQQLVHACVHGDDTAAAMDVKDLLLPDPVGWFRKTFGEEYVKGLVAEYAIWSVRIPQLPAELVKNRSAGKTELLTERFETSDDDMATTFQAIALRKMKVRTSLYSMRLVEPGEEDGWHVWSFAWVDGKVRFVGRLMALTPIAADADLAEMGSWRKKVEREIRTGK